jgi:hypothetical protein
MGRIHRWMLRKRRWTTDPAAYGTCFTSGGRTEEEVEDIDQPSDEEEDTGTGRRRAPRATQVKFPTEEEF